MTLAFGKKPFAGGVECLYKLEIQSAKKMFESKKKFSRQLAAILIISGKLKI